MSVDPKKVSGMQRRPLLQRDIEAAQLNTKSSLQAARYLNVSYSTYKKYAELYGIFERHKNPKGVGIPRTHKRGAVGLDTILAGEHPNYNRRKLKERLIRAGYLPQECCLCGFNQTRMADGRCPLILHNKDGNEQNFALSNLELRCYNCTYLTTGNIKIQDPLGTSVFNDDLMTSGNVTMDDIEEIQKELMKDT
jgi:hypothetical protein